MRKVIKRIRRIVLDVTKSCPPLRDFIRESVYFIKAVRYKWRGIGISTDEKVVAFQAFKGQKYACSPKAIYEEMLQDERFKDYTFVWLFKNPEEFRFLKENPNTKIMKYGSKNCEKLLSKAKFWIFNFRAPEWWLPKKDQVYVQCWHGTPLKRLGFDLETSDNAMNSTKEIRKKYISDTKRFKYFLSPCGFSSEKFISAWDMKTYGKEDSIIELGYPRNDYLSNYKEEEISQIRKELGIESVDKKVILYAPTWRDNQHKSGVGYVYENPVDFDLLREELGEDYIILFRAHYLVASSFDFAKYEGFVYDVSQYDDINRLYVVSDLLVTDYSSVFFDYAILNRPMIFYMYDLADYRDNVRGFYLDLSELPGPIVEDDNTFIEAVKAINFDNSSECLKEFNEKFNSYNDGKAARRVIGRLFDIPVR
jgi:CDP-glycerol glycerophosphotransferase